MVYTLSHRLVPPITLIIKLVILEDRFEISRGLVLPRTSPVNRSYNVVSIGSQALICSKLTSKRAEAKAVRAGLKALVLAVDLIALAISADGASNKAGLKAERSKTVGTRGGLGELINSSAGRDGGGVRHSVAQFTVRSNVNLLAARNNDTKAEGPITTREYSVIAWGTGTGRKSRRAIAGGCAGAEVKLSVASGEREKVNGRSTARRDDAEVVGAGGRGR
jgi:hypothetical protein